MTPKSSQASIDLSTDNYEYLQSIVVTGGADAAVVNVRQGNASGAIKLQVRAAAGATAPVMYPVDAPLRVGTGSGATPGMYIELVSGTTPWITAQVD